MRTYFLSEGDIGVLMTFVIVIAAVISVVIAILLKIVLKRKLKLYWYFAIGVLATILLFFLIMRNLDVLF